MSIMMTVSLSGMTCHHCVASVSEGLKQLHGVTDVHVALNPQGLSTATVTADRKIDAADLSAAVTEAGYHLVAQSE